MKSDVLITKTSTFIMKILNYCPQLYHHSNIYIGLRVAMVFYDPTKIASMLLFLTHKKLEVLIGHSELHNPIFGN